MAAPPAPGGIAIRPYDRACHGDGPWRVIASVFREYGYEFDTDGYDRDVQDPDAYFIAPGGGFAVAEDASGKVIGCTGHGPGGADGVFELKRLYVLAEARRGGAGERLVRWVIDEVRARGGRRIVLYSDIAFLDAHRLYRRMGFSNHRFRYADDPWHTPEWGFVMDLEKETR